MVEKAFTASHRRKREGIFRNIRCKRIDHRRNEKLRGSVDDAKQFSKRVDSDAKVTTNGYAYSKITSKTKPPEQNTRISRLREVSFKVNVYN